MANQHQQSKQGDLRIVAAMGWTTGYQKRWNDSYKMWEKYPVIVWKVGVVTLSFGT